MSPLHIAVKNENIDVVNFLLDYEKTDLNLKDVFTFNFFNLVF